MICSNTLETELKLGYSARSENSIYSSTQVSPTVSEFPGEGL